MPGVDPASRRAPSKFPQVPDSWSVPTVSATDSAARAKLVDQVVPLSAPAQAAADLVSQGVPRAVAEQLSSLTVRLNMGELPPECVVADSSDSPRPKERRLSEEPREEALLQEVKSLGATASAPDAWSYGFGRELRDDDGVEQVELLRWPDHFLYVQ